MSKKIGVKHKLFLVFIGLILAFIILEAGLRAFDYFPDWFIPGPNELDINSISKDLIRLSGNKDLKFEHNPGSSYFTYDGFGINYTINKDGFRDDVYSKNKDSNTFRIIVLGDSLTYGIGVKQEETYPKVLERRLNENFEKKFEVLNFGVGGYNTVQEVAQFEEYGLDYNSDLVVVGYFMNDPYNVTGINIIQMAKGEFVEKCYLNMIFHSRVPCFFKNILTKSRALLFVNDAVKRIKNFGSEDKLKRVNKDKYLMNIVYSKLRDLKGMAGLRDIKVVFVIIPVLEDFDDPEWRSIYKQIEGNTTLAGIPTVNIIDNYKYYSPEELKNMKNDVSHPNKLGHEIIGNSIYEKLINDSLVL